MQTPARGCGPLIDDKDMGFGDVKEVCRSAKHPDRQIVVGTLDIARY